MKKHSYIRAALGVAIVGVSALAANIALAAAEPVVIWDGDFSSLTKDGYTINLNGHVVSGDGKFITIGSGTNGVEIDWATGISAATVLFKCENVPVDYVPNKNQCFASVHTATGINRVGITRRGSDGLGQAIWANELWGNSPTPPMAGSSGAQKLALGYQYNTGTVVHREVDGEWETVLNSPGLGSPNFDANSINGFSLLGYRGTSGNMITLAGARITGIAIFTSKLTLEEASAYRFSTDPFRKGDIISFNFAQEAEGNPGLIQETDIGANTLNGFIPWYGWSQKQAVNSTIENAVVYMPDIDETAVTTASMHYSAIGAWNYGYQTDPTLAPEYKYMYYFLARLNDDDDTQNITISDIPFDKYDLYLYFSGHKDVDGGTFRPFTVQGTQWTVSSEGMPVSGSSNWGSKNLAEPVLGSNAVIFSGLGDETFSLTGSVKGGGVCAVQIVNRSESRVVATMNKSMTWSELWADGGEPKSGKPVQINVEGNPTLTLDKLPECGAIYFKGEGDITITSSSKPMLVDTMSLFNGNGLTGRVSIEFNVKSGYEATEQLRNAIKAAGDKFRFVFKGAGENGVTLDYGETHLNTTLSTHIVFDGGKHALQMRNESAGLKFGANASPENPTLRVTGGAYLVFNARNICGWSSGVSNANGIIRVDDGSTAEIIPTAGTCYWAQQIYLEPGATLAINDNGTNFRVNGGTGSGATAQFYVPDNVSDMTDKPAIIKQLGTGGLYVNGQGTANMAVYVGENSKLIFNCNVERCTQSAGDQVTKYGAGILEASNGKLTDISEWQLSGGTLVYDGELATVNLNGSTLVGNEMVAISKTLHVAGGDSTVKNVMFLGTTFEFGTSSTKLMADNFVYSPAGDVYSEGNGVVVAKDLTINKDTGLPSDVGLDVNSEDGILRLVATEWETGRTLCGGTLTAPSGKVKRTIYLGDKAYKTKVLFDTGAKTIKVFKPGLLFFVQ